MKPTLTTRKPILKLSNLDLRTFPIWEFALGEEGVEGRDETWVKPVASTTIPLNSYSQIVAATFRSEASLTTLGGFMVVTTASKEIIVKGIPHNSQGVSPGAIITESNAYQHIPVEARSEIFRTPLRAASVANERANLAKLVGLEPNQFFPLTYQRLVNIEGESWEGSGTIE